MPEDVIAKLAAFTPAPGLDRDEVLFRAGRASAPSPRPWKLLAAALAAAQAATALAWVAWPRQQIVVVTEPATPTVPAVEAPEPPAGSPGASSYFVLSRTGPDTAPRPEPDAGPAERRPVLTAGSRATYFE